MQHISYAETKDIHGMVVVEMDAHGCRMLRLTGLIFHSAIVAHHIELHHERDAVHVLVSMSQATPHKSGRFDVLVPLPPAVRQVTFGTARSVIWSQADRTAEAPATAAPQREPKFA